MEKILLKQNKAGLQKALRLINVDLDMYNKLIAVIEYNTDKIEISALNIESILEDPKDFIFDLIVDKSQLSFNGLPISKKKAIDLVEFPKEFDAIITEFTKAKQNLSVKSPYVIDSDVSIDRLTISDIVLENGKFTVSESYLEEVNSEFVTYTRTENQVQAYKLVKQLLESMNGLMLLGVASPSQIREIENFGIRFYDEKPLIDIDQILRLRK